MYSRLQLGYFLDAPTATTASTVVLLDTRPMALMFKVERVMLFVEIDEAYGLHAVPSLRITLLFSN
jgi:hypothetical protein